MVQIPDSLRCLFTAEIERHEDSFVIGVPKEEIDAGTIMPEKIYRIVLFSQQNQFRSRE